MITTWVLLIAVSGSTSFNGPIVVPNLVSYEECVRVSGEIVPTLRDVRNASINTKCIEVRNR